MNEFKAGELVRGSGGWLLGKLGLFMGYDEPHAGYPYARVLIDRSEYIVMPEDLEKVQ